MNKSKFNSKWWLPAALAVVAVSLAAFWLPLPSLFPYSDAAILGGAALFLALGLGLMLPDGWLHSETARLAHAFKEYHGVSGDRAEVALGAVQKAHDAATRLRVANNGFQADLAKDVAASADRLDDVARVVFYRPDVLPKYQALIIRAESVIEAIEDHAKVREKAVSESEIETSRGLVRDGLASLSGALDASQQKDVATILNRIEASVATADVLLRPKG